MTGMFKQISELTGFMHQAMNGLSTRQKTIANNLSNADTPGYKGTEVIFEKQLQEKLHPQLKGVPADYTHPAHLSLEHNPLTKPVVVQLVDSTVRNDGNNLDLELEMTKMAQTQLNYSAVAQLLATRIGHLKYVISDGGR